MLTFTSSTAIMNYLPAGGTPASLAASATNPTTTASGVLGGQVLALKLNVAFDLYDPNFSGSSIHLNQLIVNDPQSPCYNMTVQQVLDEANKVLGGCQSTFTASQINGCVTNINENFDNGTVDNGFLRLP